MPRRSLSQSSFFDPEFVMPQCLQPGTLPWLLARHRSLLFPRWLLRGWRGEGRRGRGAWPPAVLMTLLLLRWSERGTSRLGATKRAAVDARWRAAMGLNFGAPTPDEKTLREFEAFVRRRHPECDVSRIVLFHEHVVRLCLQHGVVNDKAIWSIDSTPMWCYGAVLDTLRLLGDGTRALALAWAKATGESLESVAQRFDAPHLVAPSTKGYFRIDWRDAQQRADVIDTLARCAIAAVEHVRRHITLVPSNRRKRLLRRCSGLLRVIRDDLQTDDAGRLVIARRVAKDRLISVTDPQARHGHKSERRTFDGFKLHLAGDAMSGLITAVTVTAGNVHDGAVAHRLIRRAARLYSSIDAVLGDTAYGGAKLRYLVRRENGVRIVAPPPAVPGDSERLTRDRFRIDFETKTATCAAGVTTTDHSWVYSKDYNTTVSYYRWPKQICRDCPLRRRCCGDVQGGRRIRLHAYERELRQARIDWADPAMRQAYRARSQGERLVHRVVRHGGRNAGAWGLSAAHLQAHAIVCGCNLALLARALAPT